MSSINQELIKANKYTDVISELNKVLTDTHINYPVNMFIRDGKIQHDVYAIDVHNQIRELITTLSDEDTTLKTISLINLDDLRIFADDKSNIMLHNYANALSHRRKEHLPSMTNIRTWNVITHLLSCASIYNEADCDTTEWTIPVGWYHINGDN